MINQSQQRKSPRQRTDLLAYTGLDRAYFPTRNQRTPAAVLREDKKNSKDTQSLKYFNGEKYTQESCEWFAFPKICCRLSTLEKFYPREVAITRTKATFESLKERYYCSALTFTAVSWVALFQFARRGRVAPILRQYGRFFGTHRLFRHYLYAAAVPITLAYYLSHKAVVNQVSNLWSIHANRLNNKILDDSFGTIQVPISRDFKVNIYRSVIPQEIDIQENINAKLSIKELGDSGIEDFEFQKHVPEAAEGGEDAGEEGSDDGEEKAEEESAPADEEPQAEASEPAQQSQVPESAEPAQAADEQTAQAPAAEQSGNRKIKLSELDLDNLDIDSINLDDLDLSELGLDFEDN